MSDWCSGDAVYGGGSERCDDDGGCSGGSEARCLLSKGAEVMLAIKGGSDGEGATCSFSLALYQDLALCRDPALDRDPAILSGPDTGDKTHFY